MFIFKLIFSLFKYYYIMIIKTNSFKEYIKKTLFQKDNKSILRFYIYYFKKNSSIKYNGKYPK
jgi:hypothetical protein